MSNVAIPIQAEQDDDEFPARRSQAVPIIASDELVRRAQQRVPQAVPLEDSGSRSKVGGLSGFTQTTAAQL